MPYHVNVMRSKTQYAELKDAKLAYRDTGSGVPVLFVHGAVSDHRVWEPMCEAFESTHRCVALDLRHFGASIGGDSSDFSLETHSSDLGDFIEALQLGPVHLIGHSYGSVVALAATVARPDLVASLFLSEPSLATAVTDAHDVSLLRAGRAELAAVGEALTRADTTAAVESFFDWSAFAGAFASLPMKLRSVIVDNAPTLQLLLSTPPPRIGGRDLAGIKVPVSILLGEKTKPYFAIQVRAVQQLVPNSVVATNPDGYHGSIFVEANGFNQALANHLTSAPPRPAFSQPPE
ncbi:MAG TPA: alpha/beta hydrolase [Rubrivivax sp.]|nr:alpha/beta hydrolase [Rubrivivax sp.]